MLSLRFHFKEPLFLSFCATLGLHLIFFIGIIVFMTEEYYTIGIYGPHHRRHHHKHFASASAATNTPPAGAAQPNIPEPDERFVSYDDESKTYRLSPELIKAFKSLDIAPILKTHNKAKEARKAHLLKEKAPEKIAKKAKMPPSKKLEKKQKPELNKQPKHSAQEKQKTVIKTEPKAIKQTPTQPVHTQQKAPPTKTIPQVQANTVTAPNVKHAPPPVQAKTATQTIQPETTYEDEEPKTSVNTNDTESEDDAYDDDADDEGTDESGTFDTDTLSLAAADAHGGILSARQNQAAKQLSTHIVKQWKPPAGCHDASPVHIEITVQHDGTVVNKIIKNSSMPILNFAVKRMVAQFSTKTVQEMLEHARGTKLILIFKG